MNNPLLWAGVALLVIAAFCLAKTWLQPAGILATVGAVLIVIVVLTVGIPALGGAVGYAFTTIFEMKGDQDHD
ncbi:MULTISPECIES: hypothetical protein [Bradyrhizobium]|uniref:Uncharacterized protein n=1 Tax=Bradyrhizobium septentrionale TaxID=1404411 RepID=A0A973ZZY1_9BRAD|nr:MULTISPECIES: hypothetical protein [Bradyrhizobium]MCK7667908.1 hypothetical protein [Bradyrhizobium sp. 2S1]QIG97938.1 hypothetical protein G6P99_40775 [Bradyrhizobium sp. 6(2017)]UGY12398.1 hypothetical protein HAP48_0027560 [Bradyrhizobium septentrionale]UGY25450.1 hypothetical protein HU675_0000375 [Bradyrhizobium septentrionale]